MRFAGDDRVREGAAQARPARLSRHVLLGIDHAMKRVVDAVITGAAAEIALQHPRQVPTRRLVEGRGGHDHARCAEAALKGLCIEKGLLHGVQLAVLGEALDCRDRAALGPIGRHQAAMERQAIQPHRASAAIALVATLLDAEPSMLAQERPEALAGGRLGGQSLAVDREVHR